MGLAGAYSVNASLVPKKKPSWTQTSHRPEAYLACTDSGRLPGLPAGACTCGKGAEAKDLGTPGLLASLLGWLLYPGSHIPVLRCGQT